MALNFPINPNPGDRYTPVGYSHTYEYDGVKWVLLTPTGGGLENPLTADLDVGNFGIISTITGDVYLENFVFDADQAVGVGVDNYVLTYDQATNKISLEPAPGAGGGNAWSDPVDADIIPDTDSTWDLGRATERFAELHVDQIVVNADGNVALGAYLLAGDQALGPAVDNFVLTYDNVTGRISLEAVPGGGGGNAWSDPVDSNITPDTNNLYDLGTGALRFKDIFGASLDVTGDIIVGASSTVDGRDVSADGTKLDTLNVAAQVPAGGTTGQVLSKVDNTNYNTEWSTPSGGGSGIGKGDPFVVGDLLAVESSGGAGSAESVGFAASDVARLSQSNTFTASQLIAITGSAWLDLFQTDYGLPNASRFRMESSAGLWSLESLDDTGAFVEANLTVAHSNNGAVALGAMIGSPTGGMTLAAHALNVEGGLYDNGQRAYSGNNPHPQATTAIAGVAELAEQAEVDTGTGTNTIVTPETLAGTTFTEAKLSDLDRTRWKGEHVIGQTGFVPNDVQRDSGWLMVANAATDDRPAPVPSGLDKWVSEEVGTLALAAQTPVNEAIWYLVQDYTIGDAGVINGYRYRVPDISGSFIYELWTASGYAGETLNPRQLIGAHVPSHTDWIEISAQGSIVLPGQQVQLVLIARAATQNNQGQAVWQIKNTGGSPSSEEANFWSSGEHIRFHNTPKSGDASFLSSVTVGGTISFAGTTWTITGLSSGGSWQGFDIEPAQGRPSEDERTVTFTWGASNPIPYERDTDFYDFAFPAGDVRGYEGNSYPPGAFNDHGYGLDLLVDTLTASADWDVMVAPIAVGGAAPPPEVGVVTTHMIGVREPEAGKTFGGAIAPTAGTVLKVRCYVSGTLTTADVMVSKTQARNLAGTNILANNLQGTVTQAETVEFADDSLAAGDILLFDIVSLSNTAAADDEVFVQVEVVY